MMTQNEFIEKAMSVPWVNRGDTFDGVDCYGIYKLYAEHVLGKQMPELTGYKENAPFNSLHSQNIEKHWRQVGRWQDGAMVTFYNLQNKPVHIGICVGELQVLHARGNVDQAGKVEVHKLHALDKIYHKKTFHGLI